MFDVEKTPARIADAALTCFAYEDYSATSLSKIAAAADTSKQVVLHHFRSKEQLYSQVLDNVCSELMRALEEARLASNSTSEQLERFLLTLLDAGNEEVLLVTSRALASASYIDIDFDQWPLQPLFDELRLLSSAGDGSAKETQERSFALVYGLIGSASFFSASRRGLARMYGIEIARRVEHALRREFGSRTAWL